MGNGTAFSDSTKSQSYPTVPRDDRTIFLQTWLFLRQGIHPAAAHFLTFVVMELENEVNRVFSVPQNF